METRVPCPSELLSVSRAPHFTVSFSTSGRPSPIPGVSWRLRSDWRNAPMRRSSSWPMPHRLTYDFRREREFSFEHPTQACLALVDLESYPAAPEFADRNFDRLDLLQHLCTQMDALTATMWETPDANLRLRFLWAPDQHIVNQLSHSGHHVFAAGWVRSSDSLSETVFTLPDL